MPCPRHPNGNHGQGPSSDGQPGERRFLGLLDRGGRGHPERVARLSCPLWSRYTCDHQGRWWAPDDIAVPERYRALVAIAVAAGRDLTRSEMIDALVAAGYAPTSARVRKIRNHPLIRHTGPNRYRIVGEDSRETGTWSAHVRGSFIQQWER